MFILKVNINISTAWKHEHLKTMKYLCLEVRVHLNKVWMSNNTHEYFLLDAPPEGTLITTFDLTSSSDSDVCTVAIRVLVGLLPGNVARMPNALIPRRSFQVAISVPAEAYSWLSVATGVGYGRLSLRTQTILLVMNWNVTYWPGRVMTTYL